MSSATDSTFVPTITCTLVSLNFITPFAPVRFNAASFTKPKLSLVNADFAASDQ